MTDRAKEILEWLETPEGREKFEMLRKRRFSSLVKPIVPEHLRDECTFVCHRCEKEECECPKSE